MNNDKVIFITDDCEREKDYSIKSNDSEGNKLSAKFEMEKALSELFSDVRTTYSVNELARMLNEDSNTFVVTTLYGVASQDSKSIVPTICKAYGTPYLGADAYTHMICNDKHLSKSIIKKFGLGVIPGIIIYSAENNSEISEIKRFINNNEKVIVKPCFGGGSNGIISDSVVSSPDRATELCRQLIKYQEVPVLIEKYIEGHEVSVAIIGSQEKIDYFGESKLTICGKDVFTDEVFGLESKKINPKSKSYSKSSFIDLKTKEKMIALFKSFNKVEFMRIDVRVDTNGDIHVLELSPDCYIGTSGAFYETVKEAYGDFNNMVKCLVENAISNQQSLLSNAQQSPF